MKKKACDCYARENRERRESGEAEWGEVVLRGEWVTRGLQ